MSAPGFWHRKPGLVAGLLAPAAAVWRLATARRVARAPKLRAGVPVICVGNMTVGGAGKTPTVMALTERLIAAGAAPHVVTRGHGGRTEGPLRVALDAPAAEVGDEALLHAALAPTWVSKDRAAGAAAAEAAGAGVILLDDGFQNPDVAKDLSILVVDAEKAFGNGRIVPAGPLREPVEAALARADLVLLIGAEAVRADCLARHPALATRPVIGGTLRPLDMGMPWTGVRVLAFAGIGRPEKFFASLRAAGAEVAATRAFADHQPFGPAILARLEREAAAAGATLVTTEKDMARLPPAWRAKVRPFPVRLALDPAPALDAALAQLLGGAAEAGPDGPAS
ncbi:MAG: tetraacyldisaccharide 4'-kinase [Pseudomonadota bacterium]